MKETVGVGDLITNHRGRPPVSYILTTQLVMEQILQLPHSLITASKNVLVSKLSYEHLLLSEGDGANREELNTRK